MSMMNPRIRIAIAGTQRAASAVSAPTNMVIRSMSASAKVWVNKDTRVICQGFTGKQVCVMYSIRDVSSLYLCVRLVCYCTVALLHMVINTTARLHADESR